MILTLLEHDRGALNKNSLEALTYARTLASRINTPLHAAVVGANGDLANALGSYGADTVHLIDHPLLGEYTPDGYAAALAALVRLAGPQAVIASGTDRGNEVMAHVAARLDLPLAANCTEVTPGDPAYTVTRVRWGGSLLEEAQLGGEIKLLTVAPNAVAAEPASAPTPVTRVEFEPELAESDARVRVTSRVHAAAGKVSLADARVVVGGGRGVGSAEGFKLLDELAELLGGAVGGSRAVTSLGWRAHADQIGQTGTRIAPELYIACGISGAIQHMVGAKAAKHILAINTDPEAPIMAKANYVVVGDLAQVLPALSKKIKERRAS
jgi:electron transfer flavoprotein alpha subunit